MTRQAPNQGYGDHAVTRRAILTTGAVAGLGTAALTVLGAPSLTAATGVYGGHATILSYAFPEAWDPHVGGNLAVTAVVSPLYNQVVEFNPFNPSEIIGDLATRWEVTDAGATYTFHLHQHVKWWDGKDLTAEDVAFSLNRMIESGKPRPRVGLLRPYIQSAEVPDRYTVRVRLYYPSPAFLQFLAVDYMKVVPKHVVEAGVDINVWENIVGSGPFKIKAVRRGDSVTLAKNPQYFKPGRPYLDGLTVITITDRGTAAAAIKAGKIQMTLPGPLGVDDVLKLERDLKGKYTLYWQQVTNGQHFFPNVERGPWKDVRLSKALSLATDRHEIQKAFGAGKYLLGAPFPPDSWYGTATDALLTLPGYRIPKEPDIAEAKALLKAAGYDPPSKLGKRVLTTPVASDLPDLAQLWAAQMRRNLGLEIEIKLVDGPTGVTAFTAGDFDLGIWGYGYNIPDPDDYVNAIYGPGTRNYTRWRHPEFVALLEQQSREVDRDKRRHLLRRMEDFLLTVEDPYIPNRWLLWFYLVSDKVRTEAGAFQPPETVQTVLKQEHWWLEK
jgi:peptide/nickel transport system substrate-binding protein